MTVPIYFQWQNEHLATTIYPLREQKLRDFLVYEEEITRWAEYKDRKVEDLPQERQAYRAEKSRIWTEALKNFDDLKAYFLRENVSADYQTTFPSPDPLLMERINALHRQFSKWFPTYNNPRKERIFIAERIREFEELRKKRETELKNEQRILNNMPLNWGNRPAHKIAEETLRTVTLKMVDQELGHLYKFLSAFTRLEKPRAELSASKAKVVSARAALERKLNAQRLEVQTQAGRLDAILRELSRFSNPPSLADCKAYFLQEDVSEEHRKMFANPDAGFMAKINAIHKDFARYFPGYKDANKEKYFINQRVVQMEGQRRLIAPANLIALQMADEELRRLSDFQWLYNQMGKTAVELSSLIQKKEAERTQLENQLGLAKTNVAGLEAQLAQMDLTLSLPEQDQVMALLNSQDITLKDIVRGKVEQYKDQLSQKNHQELLELVVEKFRTHPKDYPFWLQYMVIHFSGMRYKSAHGSWADPKDLLLSLRIKAIQEKINQIKDEDAIAALCEDAYDCYQRSLGLAGDQDAPEGEECPAPKLAQTKDPRWKAKIQYNLRALDPTRLYGKRKALLDLQIDEETYEIETSMSDQEALDELETMKEQLPDWMWNEVVRLTDLRLEEVKDEKWEMLSPDDLEEKQDRSMGHFREIMMKWKSEHLTGWREEHDRANRLIVTRAVCNEVAEHIQHLRGNSPPGGLTAKPEWYLRKEKDPKLAAGKPFFVKPRLDQDFKEGASILWLRWVDEPPNAWRIAHPLTLKNSEGLLPREQISTGWGEASKPGKKEGGKVEKPKKVPGEWEYLSDGSAFKRTRSVESAQPITPAGKKEEPSKKKPMVLQTEYLRWMHEATVAKVAETVDGMTVLTFETALPYEDKRQSTIGVFKHSVGELRYYVTSSTFVGSFVGYTPEGDVPYIDLKEMLDWNKILRREVVPEAELQAYWDKLALSQQKPAVPAPGGGGAAPAPGQAKTVETQVEVAPPIAQANHKETITCYDVDAAKNKKEVYQPKVELKRGVRLFVLKASPAKVGKEVFYPVSLCEAETRAQDLYVLSNEIIDAPVDQSSAPMMAKGQLGFYRLAYANAKGKPVMARTIENLKAGSKVRVSSVHRATGDDKGNGIVNADGNVRFYLVLECLDKPSLQGLFVRVEDVVSISEKDYKQIA